MRVTAAAGGCYTTEEQRSRRNCRDEYGARRMSTGTAQLVAVADASLKYCYLHDPLAAPSGRQLAIPASQFGVSLIEHTASRYPTAASNRLFKAYSCNVRSARPVAVCGDLSVSTTAVDVAAGSVSPAHSINYL